MEKDASYPSGHSTMGTLYAIVLSQLMPDLKDQLLARGQQIGWDRVIAGVHYPSDIQAGRVLGQKIAQSLLANPDFQEALIRARAEIKAFRDAQSRMDGSALENAHGH